MTTRETSDDGRELHTLNMDIEVPGHDLKRRMIEFMALLEDGRSVKVTFRSGGEVKDAWMYYQDGRWQLEIIKYDGRRATPAPSVHGPKEA